MSPDIKGKYKIELNYPGNGRLFLNFWDSIHGNDVVVEIDAENKMWHTPDGEPLPNNISFNQFLKMVEESIKKRKY